MVNDMKMSGTLSIQKSNVNATLNSKVSASGTLATTNTLRGENIRLAQTVDYETLLNKPQINGIELIGNKSAAELGLQNTLIAGNGINITDNIISITDLILDCGTSEV